MTETAAQYARFNEAWSRAVLRHPELRASEKTVMLALLLYRNRESGLAWPSSRSLADACDVSLQTARRSLQKGEKLGLLLTVKNGVGGAGMDNKTSVRRFLIPRSSDAETLPTGEQGPPNAGNTGEQGAGTLLTGEYPPYSPVSAPLLTGEYLTPERTPEEEHLNNNYSPTVVGGDPNEQTEQTDFDYFLNHIEPVKRSSFTRYCERLGVEYQWALDEFTDACGMSLSRNWIKKFLGFTRDWAESHAA